MDTKDLRTLQEVTVQVADHLLQGCLEALVHQEVQEEVDKSSGLRFIF